MGFDSKKAGEIAGNVLGVIGLAVLTGLAIVGAAAASVEAAEQAEADRAERDRLAAEADMAAPPSDTTPVSDKIARSRELRAMADRLREQGRHYAAGQLDDQAVDLLGS